MSETVPLKDSERSNELRWQRIQVLSGAVFAVFLFFHLVNQFFAVLGPGRYDSIQRTLRFGYQFPVVEVGVVVVPLLVHMVAAVRRVWLRRGRPAPAPSFRLRLHRLSGAFLLLVILGHFGATRGTDVFFGTPPRFLGVAWSFQWVPFFYWPYYTALGLCGWYHLVSGLSVAAAVFPQSGLRWLGRKKLFYGVVSVGSLGILIAVLSFGGVLADVAGASDSPYAKSVLSFLARFR